MNEEKEVTLSQISSLIGAGPNAIKLIDLINEYGEQQYIKGKKYIVNEIEKKLKDIL